MPVTSLPFKLSVVGGGKFIIVNTDTFVPSKPLSKQEAMDRMKVIHKTYPDDPAQRRLEDRYETIEESNRYEINEEDKYEKSGKIISFKYLDKKKDIYVTLSINKMRDAIDEEILAVIDFMKVGLIDEGYEEDTEEFDEQLKERWETYQKYKY